MHIAHHRQHGDYNSETSVFIGLINPRCTEEDIVEELNLMLRDDRIKKEKEASLTRKDLNKKENPEESKPAPEIARKFIMSCLVLHDQETKRTKRCAFVDFNCPEAQKLCIQTWDNKRMIKYPNRLQVAPFEQEHVKMTREERSKTRERGANRDHTNLYVEKLPYTFQEKDVFELFSRYGTVKSVKIKKP